MGRFRGRPIAVGARRIRKPVTPAWNGDARQFLPGEGRPGADVMRVAGGQTGVGYLFCDAEPPEDFHRPGRDMVALGLWRLHARALFDPRALDPPPRQINRKREPDRSGADDQDSGFIDVGHLSYSERFRAASIPAWRPMP